MLFKLSCATYVFTYTDLDMAIAEFDGMIAGKRLRLFKEGTNAMPEDAEAMADILVQQKNIDILIGPLSGNEGLAIRDFAKQYPEKTFMNGIAGAQLFRVPRPQP